MLGDRLQHCREGVGAGKQPADAACLYLLASQTSPVTHTCWAADQWLQVVLADEEGCIAGLLGNKLRLNPEWSNPQGGWLWVVVGAGSRTGITILRPFQCFCLTVQGQCVLLFAGEWLVGAKAAYELFPAGLKSRLQVAVIACPQSCKRSGQLGMCHSLAPRPPCRSASARSGGLRSSALRWPTLWQQQPSFGRSIPGAFRGCRTS